MLIYIGCNHDETKPKLSPLFYSLRLRSRCTKGWLAESFPFGLIACGWRQVFKIVVRRPKKKRSLQNWATATSRLQSISIILAKEVGIFFTCQIIISSKRVCRI